MWSTGVLLFVMLMAEFPFDSQQMDGHSAEDEDQMTYNVWEKQVRGGGGIIPIPTALQDAYCMRHSWLSNAALLSNLRLAFCCPSSLPSLPQHKGCWRTLKANAHAVSCFSHDLKDLLDKVFEMDPVSAGAWIMLVQAQPRREMDSIKSVGREGCQRNRRKRTRLG